MKKGSPSLVFCGIFLSICCGLLSACIASSEAAGMTGSTDDSEDADRSPAETPDHEGDGDIPDPDPILDNDGGQKPVLGGQGGAYESETPVPPPCVRVLSLGSVAPLGAVPGEFGMDAIVKFINDRSSAQGTYLSQRQVLTEGFLEPYQVVLLQDLSSWQFSLEELGVFQKWVKQGGAVMALSGYDGDTTGSLATNELLSFTGLNFTTVETATHVADCGYCLGTTTQQGGWNAQHPIAEGLSFVGAFRGRAVRGEGDVVASQGGVHLAMTREIEDGRVFLFHDDWVTYATLWAGESLVDCSSNPSCADVTVGNTYQMERFWYNALDWLAGSPECFELG